jgi:hypothetical protein
VPDHDAPSSARLNVVTESEQLHQRVRSAAATGPSRSEFDALALEIAAFQARWSPGFRRLVERHARRLDSADDIPAVPAAAFRSTRVAVHPPELDQARFVTSGTTAERRGTHAFRTTTTYRALATRLGRRALLPSGAERAVVVALAPQPSIPVASSLAFMMQAFMDDFDGRAVTALERWLIRGDAIDVAGLRHAARTARERSEPLLVLGTSLALAALLETPSPPLDAPENTVVMQTGGFKGRTTSVDPERLRAEVARRFAIAPERVIAEYGMTELSSQLYEVAASRRYTAPAWLRVTAVDPVTLAPVAEEEAGLARFVDLANVDSAVAIVTDDLIRARAGVIELLGRRADAPARGCSLALESLLLSPPRS